MDSTYKILAGLTVPKQGLKRRQFFTSVYIARRLTDNQRGLLFQHQQQRKDGTRRKLGTNFFVPEKDLPGFISILKNSIAKNGHHLTSSIANRLSNILTPSMEIALQSLEKEIEQLENELEGLSNGQQREIDYLQQQLSIKDNTIAVVSKYLEKIKQRRQRVRIIEMEQKVHLFKKYLSEFKDLVERGDEIAKLRGVQQESLYQNYLTDHFWMFGPEYISVKSKPRSSTDRIPDLLLQRADGFSDVIELENPTDPLFVNVIKRPEQSSALKEALAQVMDYVDDYAIHYRDEFYQYGIDTYKPNGIIIIGRRVNKDLERRRRQLNAYLHSIKIWTYDDLISNAEQVISLLETGPMAVRNYDPSLNHDNKT